MRLPNNSRHRLPIQHLHLLLQTPTQLTTHTQRLLLALPPRRSLLQPPLLLIIVVHVVPVPAIVEFVAEGVADLAAVVDAGAVFFVMAGTQAFGLEAFGVEIFDHFVVGGVAGQVEVVDGVVVFVVVVDVVVVAEDMVILPVRGGAVAAGGVEDVAACALGGEPVVEGGGLGLDAGGFVGEDGGVSNCRGVGRGGSVEVGGLLVGNGPVVRNRAAVGEEREKKGEKCEVRLHLDFEEAVRGQ